MAIHRGDLFIFPALQLSYSHMPAMGWKHIGVPSSAPTSETRSLKTGMALAMMYAIIEMPNVQPIQAVQWMRVLAVRCLEPWRMRTKMYFAEIWAGGIRNCEGG